VPPSLVSDIPAGDGKLENLFLRCIIYTFEDITAEQNILLGMCVKIKYFCYFVLSFHTFFPYICTVLDISLNTSLINGLPLHILPIILQK